MIRLLAIVVLVVVVWLLLEWGYRKLMGASGLDPATGRRRPSSGRPASRGETLVRCDACGTYVPDSRALTVGGAGRACSLACRARLRGGAS